MHILTVLPILFPVLAGLVLLRWRPADRKRRNRYTMAAALLTSLLIFLTMFCVWRWGGAALRCTLLDFGGGLHITFRLDGASLLFSAIIGVLWPITTLYAFEYMHHAGRENKFFGFFLMTYGTVAGIAFAENFFTLYLFYELMTLATLPLVMHEMDAKSRSAGKKYLVYSMSGAALIFIVLVFFLQYGVSLDFTYGGLLNASKVLGHEGLLRAVFVLGFFGFGVKAAVFPLHGWLPAASVAPTPVTALLHAVAVVKSGAFAVMRLIYFGFGTEMLQGTAAQHLVMLATLITIVYGSAMALRTSHLKRRLAYSTISNLSYILFAFTLMTPAGMTGGLLHMIFHAVIKITLFFCAGAILHISHREYLPELEGMGRRMPLTCAAFTAAALGLMGIPPLGGFISKWTIAQAAVAVGGGFGIAGAVVLVVSAVLTVLYMMTVVVRLYFPLREVDLAPLAGLRDPSYQMTIPMAGLAVLGVTLALGSRLLLSLLSLIGSGL